MSQHLSFKVPGVLKKFTTKPSGDDNASEIVLVVPKARLTDDDVLAMHTLQNKCVQIYISADQLELAEEIRAAKSQEKERRDFARQLPMEEEASEQKPAKTVSEQAEIVNLARFIVAECPDFVREGERYTIAYDEQAHVATIVCYSDDGGVTEVDPADVELEEWGDRVAAINGLAKLATKLELIAAAPIGMWEAYEDAGNIMVTIIPTEDGMFNVFRLTEAAEIIDAIDSEIFETAELEDTRAALREYATKAGLAFTGYVMANFTAERVKDEKEADPDPCAGCQEEACPGGDNCERFAYAKKNGVDPIHPCGDCEVQNCPGLDNCEILIEKHNAEVEAEWDRVAESAEDANADAPESPEHRELQGRTESVAGFDEIGDIPDPAELEKGLEKVRNARSKKEPKENPMMAELDEPLEIPATSSYLRNGDYIVKLEDERTAGMEYEACKIIGIDGVNISVEKGDGTIIDAKAKGIDEHYRLVLMPTTISEGDKLYNVLQAQPIPHTVVKVTEGTAELECNSLAFEIDWNDLDTHYRMLVRTPQA